jgi:hypothetical protein
MLDNVTDRKRRYQSICRPWFLINVPYMFLVYSIPLTSYRRSLRGQLWSFDGFGRGIVNRKLRRHSIAQPRFPISVQFTLFFWHAPFESCTYFFIFDYGGMSISTARGV